MTVLEVYEQTVLPLHAEDRLQLARLILDDLTLNPLPERPHLVRDAAHLEQLLLEGVNSGPGITADAAYWEKKEQRVIERLGPA